MVRVFTSDSCCFRNGKHRLTHLDTEATLISSYVIVAHRTLIKDLVDELSYSTFITVYIHSDQFILTSHEV